MTQNCVITKKVAMNHNTHDYDYDWTMTHTDRCWCSSNGECWFCLKFIEELEEQESSNEVLTD